MEAIDALRWVGVAIGLGATIIVWGVVFLIGVEIVRAKRGD
jgi:UPF0716 family protein affecting phage T7 exclusion